jgi:hypothetical protein
LIAHEFGKLGRNVGNVADEFQTPVAIIAEWVNQREHA